MEETPGRVLVVTPHPDDAEFWCGGTVALWVNQGAEVHFVLCTDGGKGTSDPEVASEELGARREAEQQQAAEILGVKALVSHHGSHLHVQGSFNVQVGIGLLAAQKSTVPVLWGSSPSCCQSSMKCRWSRAQGNTASKVTWPVMRWSRCQARFLR